MELSSFFEDLEVVRRAVRVLIIQNSYRDRVSLFREKVKDRGHDLMLKMRLSIIRRYLVLVIFVWGFESSTIFLIGQITAELNSSEFLSKSKGMIDVALLVMFGLENSFGLNTDIL